MDRLVTLFAVLCPVLIVYDTPPAELHGAMVQMLFIHVPSAWMALFCYSVMAVSSLSASFGDTARRHFGNGNGDRRRLPALALFLTRFGVMRLGVPGGCGVIIV